MEKRRTKKRSVGRPPGKSPVIAMRIEPDLFEQLENAATNARRPIAAEARHRLAHSFSAEENAAQQEDVMRALENERDEARDRVDELENLLANIRVDVEQALRTVLVEAGLLKRDDPK